MRCCSTGWTRGASGGSTIITTTNHHPIVVRRRLPPLSRAARPIMAAAAAAPSTATTKQANILVVASPDSPELAVLDKLTSDAAVVVGVGKPAELLATLSDAQLASVDVILNCGVGAKAGTKQDLQALWPRLPNLRWLHSASAGLEHLLFPELVDSETVVLTNAKSVYSHSLAEYALTCASYFAKDFPRLLAAKRDGKWEPFDVEELRGRTLGVLGYGDIGQATARLARAFGMKVVALRRRTELSAREREEGVLSELFAPDKFLDLAAASDYVVAALPHTPATHGLVSKAFFDKMKPNAVFINVGRGKTVDEEALVEVLRAKRIRGAGLDVFYEEPLPASSPLWALDNVFLSPHNADRTREFQFESLELFVENVSRYARAGGDCAALLNVCEKKAGY
jgi:phosphoglycerate dehydrogenase-like enzyme